MICCKIVADFNNPKSNFAALFTSLSACGDIYWSSGELYFADYEGTVDAKKIKRLLKKAGFLEFFIKEYTKDNEPNESDEVNAWLTNRLIKMNYNLYERQSQEAFRNISKGLDILNKYVEDELSRQTQNLEKKEGESGV